MRTMLKMSIPVAAGNDAIQQGRVPQVLGQIMGLNPEAAYFFSEDGRRTALFVFDLKDPADIPGIVEPLFMGLNAAVVLTPVMNAEDLQKGLAAVGPKT